jgi:hypothetical protein
LYTILLYNPGGIGFVTNKLCKETLKMEKLKKLILDYDIDITSLTEVNKDWRKVEYDDTIWGSTAGWRENRGMQVSHNKSVAPGDSKFQVGGTAMLVLGDVSFRISYQGEDSRNLGRWSYITLTGKIMLPQLFSLATVHVAAQALDQHLCNRCCIWQYIRKHYLILIALDSCSAMI